MELSIDGFNKPLFIQVESANNGRNVKCPRCWRWHGVIENYDDLCDRCQLVILEDHPDFEAVPFILESLQKQADKYWSGKIENWIYWQEFQFSQKEPREMG